MKKGQSVVVKEQSGPWTKVEVVAEGGFRFTGWIPSQAVSSPPEPNREVIRSNAGLPKKQKLTRGEVVYVTAQSAYISLGEQEGVQVGNAILIIHSPKSQSACQIQQVSDHSSTCRGKGLSVGDVAVVDGRVDDETFNRPTTRRTSSAEKARRARFLEGYAFPKVSYVSESAVTGTISPVPFRGGAGFDTWFTKERSFTREEANLSIWGVELGSPFVTTSIDLSAWYWSNRPDSPRFRSNRAAQIYLKEASVNFSSHSHPLVASVGRIRPRSLPGIVLFDGAKVGFQFSSMSSEVGMYAGSTPDITSLALSDKHWLAGVYYSQDLSTNQNLILRQETRLGLRRTEEFGNRLEVETLLNFALNNWLDAAFDLRAGLKGGPLDGPTFDALRADIGLQVSNALRIQLGGRILERQASEVAVPTFVGSRHADTSVSWKGLKSFVLAMGGGISQEKSGNSLRRVYAGPEVRFLGFSRPIQSLAVAYQEEFGWAKGRMGSIAPVFAWGDRFSVNSRLSVSQEKIADQSTFQVANYTGLQLKINRWLSGRAYGQVSDGSGPLGVLGGIDFSGQI